MKVGRGGVDFIVKTNTGKYHELHLQSINLEKERSVKIPTGVRRAKRQSLGCVGIIYERNGTCIVFNSLKNAGRTG
jgi:hypothetical protein